jgi:hypothetical protein
MRFHTNSSSRPLWKNSSLWSTPLVTNDAAVLPVAQGHPVVRVLVRAHGTDAVEVVGRLRAERGGSQARAFLRRSSRRSSCSFRISCASS